MVVYPQIFTNVITLFIVYYRLGMVNSKSFVGKVLSRNSN